MERHFREFMSRHPTGVAIVTSVDRSGRPHGMTCSSVTSVCLSPPTLLVCLRTTSRTCGAVRERRGFAVSVLARDAECLAKTFAFPTTVDRFDMVSWEFSPEGLPWFTSGVTASADFTCVRLMEVGDHTIAFGEFKASRIISGQPLLYGMRRFFGPPADRQGD